MSEALNIQGRFAALPALLVKISARRTRDRARHDTLKQAARFI